MALSREELERLGAKVRYAQLTEELEVLAQEYPELVAEIPVQPVIRRAGARKRKPMSAAQRALIAQRVKAYWAAKRRAKKNTR